MEERKKPVVTVRQGRRIDLNDNKKSYKVENDKQASSDAKQFSAEWWAASGDRVELGNVFRLAY